MIPSFDTARIPRDEIVSLDGAADGAPIRERRISNEIGRQLRRPALVSPTTLGWSGGCWGRRAFRVIGLTADYLPDSDLRLINSAPTAYRPRGGARPPFYGG